VPQIARYVKAINHITTALLKKIHDYFNNRDASCFLLKNA
jgi:hypothetical protein